MDAEYNTVLIQTASKQNDHLSVIDLKKRRKSEEKILLSYELSRYLEKAAVERFFGRLKVSMRLMFGVVAIFAD